MAVSHVERIQREQFGVVLAASGARLQLPEASFCGVPKATLETGSGRSLPH